MNHLDRRAVRRPSRSLADLYASAPRRFSVIASHASMPNGTRSSASASSVPSATALPCMSVCMSSMPVNGFKFVPPVSNTTPLPTSARLGAATARCGPIAATARCRRRASRCRARRPGTRRRRASRARARRGTGSVMPRAFASCSIALRYAADRQHVRRQRREPTRDVVAQACARAVFEIDGAARAEQRASSRGACRASSLCDLNAGSANAAAPAAATQALGRAARSAVRRDPTSAMPSVRGLSRKHSRTTLRCPGQRGEADARRRTRRPSGPWRGRSRRASSRVVAVAASRARAAPRAACRTAGGERRRSRRARATTSKWSSRSSAARVGASEVAVARSGEKSGSSIIGPLSNAASRRRSHCLDRLSTKPDHSAAGAGVRWRNGLAS